MCAPVRNVNRFRKAGNLPVIPGTSLSAIKHFWETVSNNLYSSKTEIIIKNYSKWLMSHLSTTSVEGSVGIIPDLVAPGVQEAFITYQSSIIPTSIGATKGSTTWKITPSSQDYPNTPNINCTVSWNVRLLTLLAADVTTPYIYHVQGKEPTNSYSKATVVSVLHCHEDLFCLRGIMPTDSEAIVYVSLFPKLRKDWWTDPSVITIDQNHIDELLDIDRAIYDTTSVKCNTLRRFKGFVAGCCAGLLLLMPILICLWKIQVLVDPGLRHKTQQGRLCKWYKLGVK